ncbi:50S ribosomal protein L25 [Candidatus Saccharibacteria bacterium]|jgi:large subunit ribosomal protein L25|nr:50S ribosomal protein L25 [Candidatus Saccharibacteria bacterium]
MGDKVTLKLDERELHGKKVAKLRKDGLVPAVVYGPGIDPISVQIEDGIMSKAYKKAGTHAPIHLTIGTKKKIAMIKDVDRDPIKGTIRHVSFHAVKATDPVVAEVPVRLVGEGESEAEKAGLIVLQNIDKVEVKALPMDLPEAVDVSILGLKEAGDKVTLGDAVLPEGVEFVDHDTHHGDEDDDDRQGVTDLMVASVWEPAALAAANDSAAGDATDESEVESENGEAPAPAATEEKSE